MPGATSPIRSHASYWGNNTQAGQTVLVHSAAGGVGALALELCDKLKAFPIATIGSDAKVRFFFATRAKELVGSTPNANQPS